MNAKYATASLLLASLISVASPVTRASDDQFAGLLIGAGAGAIIGHAVNGGEGAAVGGFLGAIMGAALADDDDHRRIVVRRPPPPPVYVAPVVRYYEPPKVWGPPRPFRYEERDELRHGHRHMQRTHSNHDDRGSSSHGRR